jgi:hypothetical protein
MKTYIIRKVKVELMKGFVLIGADRVHSQDSARVVKTEKNACSWLAFPAIDNLSGTLQLCP